MSGLQATTSSHDLLGDEVVENAGLTRSGDASTDAELLEGDMKDDTPNDLTVEDVDMGVEDVETKAKAEENADVTEEATEQKEQEENARNEGGMLEGKRVKVYELRDASWFDRGTGQCKGVYDDTQDLALLIVEAEDSPEAAKNGEEGPGGFLKEELLLSARVDREDIYSRQQETLIVWTEPQTQLDIALSFQDPEGCEDIWQFLCEVQKHLNNIPIEADQPVAPSSSSPLSNSPMLNLSNTGAVPVETRQTWHPPTLANVKAQEMWLRMMTKSAAGREKAVENIIGENYVKQLVGVFEQAEDLESLDDLHALCSLMQTILLFNDNGIFEYILQDDVFMGVIGMLEYDPEFPSLKASYRQFFTDTARFRQVVEIKDRSIRAKIHQTYRLLYLKDVVLARVLDDPTFGILNGFVFFNQVDIISHIQNNDVFLNELFAGFKEAVVEERLDERKRDVVLFLHQLMIMGKGIQVPSRLALYRNLMERGLLFVCEWAFARPEAQLLHAGAEVLTLAVEHDVNAVRTHVLKEEGAGRRTLVFAIVAMMATKNMGLLSQMADTMRALLDTGVEGELTKQTFLQKKEGPVSEAFITYYYESCVGALYKPLLDLPEISAGMDPPIKLPREQIALLQHLVELLSFSILNQSHSHRASFYILSNPISRKIVSLLYIRDKPIRHAALRFVRACLRTPNHFIHRYFVKNDLLLPLLDLLEEESTRDNMLSSACMDVLDLIRKENIKLIINYLFDNARTHLDSLSTRPFLRSFIAGLTTRWEQNNEPPPPPPLQTEAESSSKAWSRDEEDYFNASDEEEIGPKLPQQKRKRATVRAVPSKSTRKVGTGPGVKSGGWNSDDGSGSSLGLDYDDGSDSEGSNGAPSPRPVLRNEETLEEVEEDLGDVAMRMRAKRAREEEEEEGFSGLLVRSASGTGKEKEKEKEKEEKKPLLINVNAGAGGGGTGEKREGTPIKEKLDMGKKIRLSFGGFGKKLGR